MLLHHSRLGTSKIVCSGFVRESRNFSCSRCDHQASHTLKICAGHPLILHPPSSHNSSVQHHCWHIISYHLIPSHPIIPHFTSFIHPIILRQAQLSSLCPAAFAKTTRSLPSSANSASTIESAPQHPTLASNEPGSPSTRTFRILEDLDDMTAQIKGKEGRIRPLLLRREMRIGLGIKTILDLDERNLA